MISIETAFKLLLETVQPLAVEVVDLCHSVGRRLAAPVCADVDSPPHRKSIMDGYAVKSADIQDTQRAFKVVETIVAGGWPTRNIQSGEASRIMTGAPVPDGADSVVMVELSRVVEDLAGKLVTFLVNELSNGKNVIGQAENFRAGETLFEVGHKIRPIDVGLLAESGAARVEVVRRPTIAILPTGNELVDVSERPQRGQIRNSNGPMLAAMARALGLETTLLPTCRDNPDELKDRIRAGLKYDVLVLTGGVSEGLLDLVPATLMALGVKEVFHKVKVKPGKPIWFGVRKQVTDKACYVFGLPGNPVSSLVGFHLFVRTAIRLMEQPASPKRNKNDGQQKDGLTSSSSLPQSVFAELSCDFEARGDRPTYWPARTIESKNSCPSNLHNQVKRTVQPLAWGGSSDLRSITIADGLILFPENSGKSTAGKVVEFYPFGEF